MFTRRVTGRQNVALSFKGKLGQDLEYKIIILLTLASLVSRSLFMMGELF